jgi:hypothetical protein
VITVRKMETMAEAYEARAATLRQAIALMNGDARIVKAKRIGAVVGQAIAARNGHRGPAPARGAYAEKATAKREATFRALKIVEESGPLAGERIRDLAGVSKGWFGPMISRGYLTRAAGGTYKRSRKVFEVRPSK